MMSLLSALFLVILLAQAQQPIEQTAWPNKGVQDRQQPEVNQERAAALLANAPRVEIEFTGNRLFPAQTLFEQMKLSRNLDQPASFLLKTPAYLDYLADDIERIRFFLGTKGYVEAKIGGPVIEDRGDYVKVTLSITTGACYRVGQIKVEGATAFAPEEIIAISHLKPGAVINTRVIQEEVFKGIREAYQDRGYLQASVDFVPNFKLPYLNAPAGAVDVTLEIDEGRVFFIRAISFSGVRQTDEQMLRGLLLIREGEPYSLRKLRESIKQLNQLGLFVEVQDKDVIMRTNNRDSWVEMTVQVTKKDE